MELGSFLSIMWARMTFLNEKKMVNIVVNTLNSDFFGYVIKYKASIPLESMLKVIRI